MKAVHVNSYGGPEVLEIKNDLPSPAPFKNQIQVEVHAVSINPYDVKIVSGLYTDYMPLEFPAVPGGDYAEVMPPGGAVVAASQELALPADAPHARRGGTGSFA